MNKRTWIILVVGLWGVLGALLWWNQSVLRSGWQFGRTAIFSLTSFHRSVQKKHRALKAVTLRPAARASQWKSSDKPQAPTRCQGVLPVSGRPTIKRKPVATDLGALTDIAFPPGDSDRIFVLEQHKGTVRVIRNGRVLKEPFLRLSQPFTKGGERGLLGIAFHPKYAQNRRLFLFYTGKRGQVVIVEYKAAPSLDRADPSSRRVILVAPQPESNHNGGSLRFGPDGYLYIGLGDGGGGGDRHGSIGNGQNQKTWLGKILRIDIDRRDKGKAYAIPRDNPFRSDKDVRPEIAYWGLRNPWRFTFDRHSGDLWIGDVGQNRGEELNFVPKGTLGLNFGWRCREGLLPYANDKHCATISPVEPVLHLKIRASGGPSFCSIVAGVAYRGCKMPGYHGTFFYNDWCTDHLRSFRWNGKTPSHEHRLPGITAKNVTSWAEDHQGEMHIVTGRGQVFKLVPE